MIMLSPHTNTCFASAGHHFGLAMVCAHLRASPVRFRFAATIAYERIAGNDQFRCAALARHEAHIFRVVHQIA